LINLGPRRAVLAKGRVGTEGSTQGTFYFSTGLRGRPRGRRLASGPRRRAISAAHASAPKGVLRVTLCRMRASSVSVMAVFTYAC